MVIVKLIILFFIYAFLGWLMEVTFAFINFHKFINRGFLIGPICPIYGYGCMLIIVLLNRFKNEPLTLFFMAILICSLLEYITSFVMEKIFKARWWDYSNKKFNLNGRICLQTMIPFGVLGTIITYYVNPFLGNLVNKVPNTILIIIAVILLIIYLVDNIVSTKIIDNVKDEIKTQEKDKTIAISAKVKETLQESGYLTKRLINAFPKFKTYREILEDIKDTVNNQLNKLNNKRKK